MINKVAKCSKPIVKNKKIARKTLKKKQTNVVKKKPSPRSNGHFPANLIEIILLALFV